ETGREAADPEDFPMKAAIHHAGALGLSLTALFATNQLLPAQPPGTDPQVPADAARSDLPLSPDISVQTRGPVHEAFAQPTAATPQPGPVIARKPPEPIPEMPPDQKPDGVDVQWIP